MRSFYARRAFLLGTASWAATSSGRAADITETLRRIDQARTRLKTLLCPFTQTRTLSLFASQITSRGAVTIVRPDRLRWAVEPPDEATYWATPEGLAYRTPQGAGNTPAGSGGALAAVLADLLCLLGGDLGRLPSRYEMAAEPSPTKGLVLTLRPKTAAVAKVIRRMELTLAPDLLAPERIVLEEPGDDRSVIVFGPAQRNVVVDPARMRPT